MKSLRLSIIFSLLMLFSSYQPRLLADGDKPSKKKLTEEEKEAKRVAQAPGTLLNRAHKKIDEYVDSEDFSVSKLVVIYGTDWTGLNGRDVRVFAEMSDGTLGIYYANADPANDAWLVFQKDSLSEVAEIVKRQMTR